MQSEAYLESDYCRSIWFLINFAIDFYITGYESLFFSERDENLKN